MPGLSSDGFWDLTAENDRYSIPANLLATAPRGVRSLEGADTVDGSSSTDLAYGNAGSDRLQGNGGNDSLLGGRDRDDLDGGTGDDFLAGNQGEDWLKGGDGNDILAGGRDADLLLGGLGDDQLTGDLGVDILVGGDGADRFSLRGDAAGLNNLDVILDFNPALDRPQLNNLAASDLRVQATSYSLSLLLSLLQGSTGSLPPSLTLPANPTPATIRQAIQTAVGVDIDPDGDGTVTGALVSSGAGELAFFVGSTASAIEQAIRINRTPLANDILTAHNQARSAVGVPALTWSASLANDAQAWANQLAASGAFSHAQNTGQGENLARGTAGRFSAKDLVGLWTAEKQFFKMGNFPNVSTTGNWADVGHYTQMVWRNTTQIGCGMATGNGNDTLVCRYSPPGNVTGQMPY
ncbi:MAG: hypothetical protein EA001_01625 [Oscillatoriales cyanobacterium]|nr:MAG: hypothetical protein EA001_01625 [Oscillatoriales cyanobacterium]